ncbi:MAG: FAD-binding oxidoreductase [Candidatus Latescibacteria bacterium]|nr:FAD-binding oxidoreductase [Candidatus Latescibacterota bacterium]
MSYDAIVIGGGIVGTSTAYHLVRAGARTLLVDRRDTGRATDAGAGILSPATNTRDPDPWQRLAAHAVGYYPGLIESLESEQEGETGFAVCGMMIVAVSEDELEPFDVARRHIFNRRNRQGGPSAQDLYEISSDEARKRFPALAGVQGAIYYRDAARVDGRLLTGALRRAAESRGLTVQETGVEALRMDNDAVTGVVTDAGAISTADVVIAGGAWSHAFGLQLGVQIPVEPQRGQIIHLGLPPAANTASWTIVSAVRGHYMVPWPDNRVVVGATRETGSGFDARTTVAGVREVLDEALRVAPGLAAAEIRDIRVGLRPYTQDLLPVLGPVPGRKNVWLATGHGPTGLQLGPYSGKLIADLITGNDLPINLDAYRITRFFS